MCILALAAAAVTLFGCDPVVETTDGTGGAGGDDGHSRPFADGTRLKLDHYDADGGASIFYGAFFDTELDVTCFFGIAGDGASRCLPSGGTIVYADTECTVPIVPQLDCQDPPRFARREENVLPQGCDDFGYRQHVHPVGDKIAPPSVVFSRDSEGACYAGFLDPDVDYYEVLEEIEPAAFVGGELVESPRGPDLTAIYFETPDGARFISGVRDEKHGVPCQPGDSGPGNRCYPNTSVFTSKDVYFGRYSDAACQSPLAASYVRVGCAVTPIGQALPEGGDGCTLPDPVYFEVGAEQPAAHTLASGACELFTGGNERFFEVGPAVDAKTFVEVDLVDVGTGRLRASTWQKDGGALYSYSSFFDTELGVPCYPNTFANGEHRCLPYWIALAYPGTNPGALGQGAFADVGCTEPLAWVGTPGPCDEPREYALVWSGGVCDSPSAVHEIGPTFTGDVYSLTADGCATGGPVEGYRALGAEVPSGTFAAVERPYSGL